MRILVLSQYFWPESFRINDVVEGLTDWNGHLHAFEAGHLGGISDRQSERLRTGKSGRARPDHDLGTDVRFALAPLAQEAMSQTNGEDYQQDTQRDAGNADGSARGTMSEI